MFMLVSDPIMISDCDMTGSDNDNADPTADDDLNENALVSKGLNRYRLEWPVAWATDADGQYAASILPKAHNFEHIGEYQICLANVWRGYSYAELEGAVDLVGLQRCAALVCVPGDRAFCSYQGKSRYVGIHVAVRHMRK